MAGEIKTKASKKRNIGLDLIRIVAFLSVIGVHFFLNTDFYELNLVGKRMYLLTVIRTSFMVCVPLFLLLTGYLLVDKDLSLEKNKLIIYYKKIIPVLLSYGLSMAVVCVGLGILADKKINLLGIFLDILGYGEYSWYVEMYIGLFLLSPCLINIWASIKDKKTHLVLLGVFCFLTLAPSVFNVYNLSKLTPYYRNGLSHLLPGWWIELYPLTFFFLGAYLKTYVDFKKVSPFRIFIFLILNLGLASAYNIWRAHGGYFQINIWNRWGSLQNTVSAVLVFVLIGALSPEKVGEKMEKILGYLSKLTFSAYILSALSDKYVYDFVNSNIGGVKSSMVYMPIIILSTAIFALIMAGFVEFVAGKILRIIQAKN